MNPESLLHEAAEMLRAEAAKGPGTMFLMCVKGVFSVTRTPGPGPLKEIVATFNCINFSAGLSPNQWASLLKKVAAAHESSQKGDASGQQPAHISKN